MCGVVDVARRAVAVASYVGTVGTRILARLLYGTLDAEALHILVGGNLRVNVVSLEYLRERQTEEEEADKTYGYKYNNQYISH